jgi:hypothetical protein
MRPRSRILAFLSLSLLAACDGGMSLGICCGGSAPALRVVNAFTTPVDVQIDGVVVIDDLAAGAIGTASPTAGTHVLVLQPADAGTPGSRTITTDAGGVRTVAAVRTGSGLVGAAVLDDTNSVVPAGATKVRVLHLAPNAGALQVYRTQPDFQQPVPWQFPFTYQSDPTSLSAPFYQSTTGTWEIRIWQAPADDTGWASAPVRLTLPLGSGERRTVLILDRPGGGVRAEVL